MWMTLSCFWGQAGFISNFLSCRVFLPLSRLTYCTYLVHPMIMMITSFQMESPIHMQHSFVLTAFFGNAVISFGIAFILSLMFEAPVIRVLKIIFRWEAPFLLSQSELNVVSFKKIFLFVRIFYLVLPLLFFSYKHFSVQVPWKHSYRSQVLMQSREKWSRHSTIYWILSIFSMRVSNFHQEKIAQGISPRDNKTVQWEFYWSTWMNDWAFGHVAYKKKPNAWHNNW